MQRSRKQSDQEMVERLMAIFDPDTGSQGVRPQNDQEEENEHDEDEQDDKE